VPSGGIFPWTQADGTNLKPNGIEILIGRDVLRSCVLVYHGASGLVSLGIQR
jgi:hypothetical protein